MSTSEYYRANPVNYSNLNVKSCHAISMQTNSLVLDNQVSVTPPAVGELKLYADVSGTLSSIDSTSTVVTYVDSAVFVDALTQSGPTTQGNFPAYQDSVSNVVVDSGISASLLVNLSTGLSSLANQDQGLAAAGERDLWQLSAGLAFNGGIMNYDQNNNVLYSTDWSNGIVGTHYSLDGGINWLSCVFNVLPTAGMLIAFNGAGLWVAVANFSAAHLTYTSIDGINFTSTGTLLASNAAINMVFNPVSNLFVTGVNTDATHWISTSPDAITWTPRVTQDYTGVVNYTELGQKNDGSVMVYMGDSQVNPEYSLDGGITWLVSSGSPSSKQAVCWSEAKQQFVAMGVTNNVIQSSDGKVWEDCGNGGFGGSVSIIYCDFPISRYYGGWGTGIGSFYSLHSTIDPHVPFSNVHLDGSIVQTQAYASVVYIQQYDRFILALDNVGIAYSTARPYIIKAANSGMSVYPQYGSIANGPIISNTLVETSLLSTHAGSNIIPANSMNLGSVTKIRFSLFVASVLALSSLTIRLRVNGSQIFQLSVLVGPITNRVIITEVELANVDNANPTISAIVNQDGLAPVLTSTSAAVNYTVNDTFDLTAQWSVANVGNQVRCDAFNMSLMKF